MYSLVTKILQQTFIEFKQMTRIILRIILYWIYWFFTKTLKIFLDYTNLLSPREYEKNDKIVLKCFQ